MSTFSRPFFNHALPTVTSPASEHLSVWLAPLNDPVMQAQMGREHERLAMGEHRIFQGETFRRPSGESVCGWRFLKVKDGTPIAVLQVVEHSRARQKPDVVIANAFVSPEHRRQGLATELLSWVESVFGRDVTFNSDLSELGEAWCRGTRPAPCPWDLSSLRGPAPARGRCRPR
jgi:hypothetical protein